MNSLRFWFVGFDLAISWNYGAFKFLNKESRWVMCKIFKETPSFGPQFQCCETFCDFY